MCRHGECLCPKSQAETVDAFVVCLHCPLSNHPRKRWLGKAPRSNSSFRCSCFFWHNVAIVLNSLCSLSNLWLAFFLNSKPTCFLIWSSVVIGDIATNCNPRAPYKTPSQTISVQMLLPAGTLLLQTATNSNLKQCSFHSWSSSSLSGRMQN